MLPLQVEICFWAGLERYFQEGFRLGDPRAYLHGPGHPHQAGSQCIGAVFSIYRALNNRLVSLVQANMGIRRRVPDKSLNPNPDPNPDPVPNPNPNPNPDPNGCRRRRSSLAARAAAHPCTAPCCVLPTSAAR